MSKILIGRTGLCAALRAALGAALIALLPPSAQAQDWPSKTVTVVVPFAAGGNTDVMARMASNKLAAELKQTFVVENRVGAGGAIAANFVAQAAPDGHTLLFGAAPQIAIVPRIQKVNYDPLKSFAPVSVFGTGPFILAVNATIPVKTLPEFVAYGKGRKLNYGSGGVGSIGHLSGALLVARAGFDSVHIPFSGGGPATSALVAGQIDMYFGNASELIPQAESGKIKLLGVATDQRMKQIPNVPTISETFPNFALSSWNGFLAPAATPRPIVSKLATLVGAAARDPAIVAQLEGLGITPNGTTPEEFAAQIAREQPLFDEAIAAAGLKN
jgi:tripartite-type tricarboxylate transporter receptor subunit TctC